MPDEPDNPVLPLVPEPVPVLPGDVLVPLDPAPPTLGTGVVVELGGGSAPGVVGPSGGVAVVDGPSGVAVEGVAGEVAVEGVAGDVAVEGEPVGVEVGAPMGVAVVVEGAVLPIPVAEPTPTAWARTTLESPPIRTIANNPLRCVMWVKLITGDRWGTP